MRRRASEVLREREGVFVVVEERDLGGDEEMKELGLGFFFSPFF